MRTTLAHFHHLYRNGVWGGGLRFRYPAIINAAFHMLRMNGWVYPCTRLRAGVWGLCIKKKSNIDDGDGETFNGKKNNNNEIQSGERLSLQHRRVFEAQISKRCFWCMRALTTLLSFKLAQNGGVVRLRTLVMRILGPFSWATWFGSALPVPTAKQLYITPRTPFIIQPHPAVFRLGICMCSRHWNISMHSLHWNI